MGPYRTYYHSLSVFFQQPRRILGDARLVGHFAGVRSAWEITYRDGLLRWKLRRFGFGNRSLSVLVFCCVHLQEQKSVKEPEQADQAKNEENERADLCNAFVNATCVEPPGANHGNGPGKEGQDQALRYYTRSVGTSTSISWCWKRAVAV